MKAGDLNAVGRGDKNNNNAGWIGEGVGGGGGVARQIDSASSQPRLSHGAFTFSLG